MTITSTGRVRHYKTNPDCPTSRHGPNLASWKRGCICPGSEQAMTDWATAEAERRRCSAEHHAPTHNAWQHGCRHPGALIAHEQWKSKLRAERGAALRAHRETGACGAHVHDTVGAYRRGCRCDLAVKLYHASHDGRQIARLREMGSVKLDNPWRQGKMAVSRINLWMLVRGFVDSPTVGERMAAVAILSRRGTTQVGIGGRDGFLNNQEIGRRIGINDLAVIGIRKRMEALAESRTQRRLADVRAKAARVERARASGHA